ncbi:hypothetical protein [Flavobacterium sp. JP2137]|uniref:hypothetical protein n=1 Tax=Flavobacterium sp. JP2137 TaxID=3414510 RepID=UPI003D2FA6EA
MEDIVTRLTSLSKRTRFVAFFILIVLMWGELIFMFTKYKTVGTLLYDEYGETALVCYYFIGICVIFILFYIASRIDYAVDKIKTRLKDNEEYRNIG